MKAQGARPLILVNPDAGAGLEADTLRESFPGADVEACPAAELAAKAAKAVERRVPYIGVAGGDGSLRCVASVLVGTGTALLPIPGGTLNHFAKAVGNSDLDLAAAAARTGSDYPVDVAEVNGRVFLNTASLGAYPRMVLRRERHERRLARPLAQLLATFEEIRHGHALHAVIDGQRRRSWVVFVGNGEYGGTPGAMGRRGSLTSNVLDVRVVKAVGRWPRTRLVVAALVGRLQRSAVIEAWTCGEVDLDVLTATRVAVALDGEVEQVETPLHFRSRAGELLVRYNDPS